jgi:Tat protein secretion system quality control protein TatD with DNase activity
VSLVAERIAEEKQIKVEDVAETTSRNAVELFGLEDIV